MQCVAMEDIGQDLAHEEAENQILRNAPRHGHIDRDLKETAHMQHLGKERLETYLDCYSEHDIPNADQRHFPPPALPTTLFIAHWQRNFAMLFDINGKIRCRAIERKKAK